MKYYIIAGEASGDLHGSNLIKELKIIDTQAEIRCWGGDLMQNAGATLIKHYKELAFMGFAEVAKNLTTILNNIKFCKSDILEFKPDVIIFIDYPGFNLRIAQWAKKQGLKTHYYISPQIWAWKESRIKAIKRDIDQLYVILPFEKDFYENKHHFKVHFVGHPLIDAIQQFKAHPNPNFITENQLSEKPIIALLPGSRKQEITKMLSVMLSVVHDFPDYQFVIAGAPGQEASFYSPFLKTSQVKLISNQTYDLLSVASAALVTSGTATLETALFKIPEVVCYKGNRISYEIAKRVVTLQFISLVNLIMNQEIVKELIQKEFNTQNLKQELQAILSGKSRENILNAYDKLENQLGGKGASKKTASLIYESIQK